MNKESKNINKTSDDIRLNTSSFLDMKINPMQEPGNYLFLGNEWGFFGAVRDGKYYAEDNIDDGEKLYSVNLFNLAVQVNKGSVVYVVGKKNELEDYWSVIFNKVATIIGKKFSYHLYYIEDFEKKFNISKKNEAYLKAISYLKETKKLNFKYVNMNPPYDKNLHLKILEHVIPMLFDDGILVNLSPIRWLQDPLAKYKKTSDWYKFKEVRERIQDIVEIPMVDACDMFSAGIGFDLGIYKITKNLQNKVELSLNSNSIVDKVLNRISQTIEDVTDIDKIDGWRVRYSNIRPMSKFNASPDWVIVNRKYYLIHMKLDYIYKDGYVGNIHWSNDRVGGGGGASKYKVGDPIPYSIHFDTEKEARNFVNSTKTTFYKYYFGAIKVGDSVPSAYLPWLGDCINPRTGKKGYEGEWTDDDFRKYFDITDSEWEEIVETMKPYLQETTVEK